jgi:purine-binding chemotaxis protein CheW
MSRFAELLDEFFYRPDEEAEGLVGLVPAAEESAPAPESEKPGDYLAFRLEDEVYAIPMAEVREIVRVPNLTEVPRGGPSLLGVMNLRGEVIPVYDVKLRLRLIARAPKLAGPPTEVEPPPRKSRILVISGDPGPAGVLVDEVTGVVKLKPSAVEPPPPGVAGGERDVVIGLGRRRDELFILLAVQQALA